MSLERKIIREDYTMSYRGNASLEKIKSLMNSSVKIEKELLDALDFGKRFKQSSVIGSNELIDEFLDLESKFKKNDISLELKNVKFIKISDDDNDIEGKVKAPILSLASSSEQIETMRARYNVKTDYMNLLELKSFYDAIAGDNDYDDNVYEELKKSFEKTILENHSILGGLDKKTWTYRCIEYKNKKYVRALVSKAYKNYSNKVSLFLTLYIMEEITNITKKNYRVSNMSITDSDIKVEFCVEEDKSKQEGTVEKGFLGITLKNNELALGKVSLSITYYIKINGRLIRLNPQKDETSVSRPLLSIEHRLNPETVIERLNFDLNKFKLFEKHLLEMNEKVVKNKITEQFVIKVIKSLSNSPKIGEPVKTKLKVLETETKNLLDLVTLYDKLDELKMEFDEKAYVDYVLYKVINEWRI